MRIGHVGNSRLAPEEDRRELVRRHRTVLPCVADRGSVDEGFRVIEFLDPGTRRLELSEFRLGHQGEADSDEGFVDGHRGVRSHGELRVRETSQPR